MTVLENRLSLLLTEFNLEKLRFLEVLFWGGLCFVLGFMSAILVTLTLVMACPQRYRLLVLGVLTLMYLAGALFSFRGLRQRIRNWPPPFRETMGELKKDIECLQTRK